MLLAAKTVCSAVRNYNYCCKGKNDETTNHAADPFPAVEPDHVVPADSLECAPETVADMHVKNNEPYKIEDRDPDVAECLLKKEVWILCLSTSELLELHVLPEMRKVKTDEAKNDEAEPNHVLGSE